MSSSRVALEPPRRAPSAASDVRIIGVVCVGHFYSLVLPPLFPLLRGQLAVSDAALGGLITASAVASAISPPVSGFLVERFGAPRILAAGLLALIGFTKGATNPSRDLLVRGATPPGASGKVLASSIPASISAPS